MRRGFRSQSSMTCWRRWWNGEGDPFVILPCKGLSRYRSTVMRAIKVKYVVLTIVVIVVCGFLVWKYVLGSGFIGEFKMTRGSWLTKTSSSSIIDEDSSASIDPTVDSLRKEIQGKQREGVRAAIISQARTACSECRLRSANRGMGCGWGHFSPPPVERTHVSKGRSANAVVANY
jgi:hypothetical protein